MSQSPILFECPLGGAGQQWIHLQVDDANTQDWLVSRVPEMDPITRESLLAEETRPRYVVQDQHLVLFLRGVNLNDNARPEDMVSIRLWTDGKRVISLRKRQLRAVVDLHDEILAGRGPQSCADLLVELTGRLLQRLEPALGALDDVTDSVEESLLEKPDAGLRESIVEVRKQAIVFRRYMAPQKDALNSLASSRLSWLSDTHRRQFQETQHQMIRLVEDLDAIRERAQIVKDELANILSDKLNHNLYVLSVVAAIFLPLGFLTGLLGVNIGGIPGVDDPNAFAVFCGFSVALVAAQIWLFKKLRWF